MIERMPALFVGHGSPMNAIEDNEYSRNWSGIAKKIKRPEAILAVSAHWFTDGTRITDDADPKMVYDMYGFPDELYKVKYHAKGNPDLAFRTKGLIKNAVNIDNSWGIDHGVWSVLRHMYPEADIPLLQLSIDYKSEAAVHYRLGQEIASLRENGVMVLGSGNIVHNLSKISWGMNGGQPWALEFDEYIKENIINRQHQAVIDYENAGNSSKLAFPTPEHFYPLLYVLGASNKEDKITVFNNSCTMGSISMTSYLFE